MGGPEITAAGKLIHPCRNVCNELAVDQDLELAHAILKVVKVEPGKGQRRLSGWDRPDVDDEAARA